MPVQNLSSPIEAVTQGPKHHFFGYYDKSPWSFSGRYMLALQVDFMDRPPASNDAATVGIIDLKENCSFKPLVQTYAWNWQQGTMLQWLPRSSDRLIIYNTRERNRFASVILNIKTGESRELPLPIYVISHDGRWMLSLNFARVARTRPGYGYLGVSDLWMKEEAPKEDGIYLMNLETGENQLVVSLAKMASFHPRADMKKTVHWFNHLLFSPDGRRFIFLHRWTRANNKRSWFTRLYTSDMNGEDICLLADDGMVSHFDWRDPIHILAWARKKGVGNHYFLFTDKSEEFKIIGEGVLDCDGHCSHSPDRRWILTDTYPDKHHNRRLLLYQPETGKMVELSRFYSPPELRGEIRCDLHPRWSRDGCCVCIDSTHEGTRQMYVIEVGSAVR